MVFAFNDLSPKFDKNRSIKADSLFFNADGTIQEVIPSLRGVGISRAESQIQIDRCSSKSATGVSLSFVDSLNTFKGWKVTISQKDSWVRYNKVDFNKIGLKKVIVNSKSTGKAIIEIRLNAVDGPVLDRIELEKSSDWKLSESKLMEYEPGIHDLFVVSRSSVPVEIDWISCK